MNKKLLTTLTCCALFMGLAACSSNETGSTSKEPKADQEAQIEAEKTKKAEEQKRLEEQRKQEEAQRQQEEKKKQQAATKQEKVQFANCKDANNAGYYDITPESPAYASHLDRDGDGVACERNKGHKKSSKKH